MKIYLLIFCINGQKKSIFPTIEKNLRKLNGNRFSPQSSGTNEIRKSVLSLIVKNYVDRFIIMTVDS